MRSHDELLEVSGYAHRQEDFNQLMHALDQELRLITPTDPEGHIETVDAEEHDLDLSKRYYQLTHDYLVPSLREWLTQKLKESRGGRAELRLAERASLWNQKREMRFLPSWWEWFNIRLLTKRANWTEAQKTMMRKAGQLHLKRAAVLGAILTFMAWGGFESYGQIQANRLISTLKEAKPEAVTGLVYELDRYRRWAESKLRTLLADAVTVNDRQQQLHARRWSNISRNWLTICGVNFERMLRRRSVVFELESHWRRMRPIPRNGTMTI
jgi:hypothetical protein